MRVLLSYTNLRWFIGAITVLIMLGIGTFTPSPVEAQAIISCEAAFLVPPTGIIASNPCIIDGFFLASTPGSQFQCTCLTFITGACANTGQCFESCTLLEPTPTPGPPTPTPTPPTCSGITGPAVVSLGNTGSYAGTASCSSGSPDCTLDWAATVGDPTSFSTLWSSGLPFNWTPTTAGSQTINLTVSDANGTAACPPYTVNVIPNDCSITGPTVLGVGQTGSYPADSASCFPDCTLNWHATVGNPTDFSTLRSSNLPFNWTPNRAGSQTITLNLSLSSGTVFCPPYPVTVTGPTPTSVPTATPTPVGPTPTPTPPPGPSLLLTVRGMLISYGGFQLDRRVVGGGPSEVITYDPEMLLALTSVLGQSSFYWQEVAP